MQAESMREQPAALLCPCPGALQAAELTVRACGPLLSAVAQHEVALHAPAEAKHHHKQQGVIALLQDPCNDLSESFVLQMYSTLNTSILHALSESSHLGNTQSRFARWSLRQAATKEGTHLHSTGDKLQDGHRQTVQPQGGGRTDLQVSHESTGLLLPESAGCSSL